jgi:prepilin-type N-terminal cleavage/methylation domain-containing protein
MKQLNRNAGFSLLELLIAVAIMAVLIGASLTTYLVVSKSNVKKASGAINDTLTLARERSKTIAAEEWNATIEASGDKVVVKLVKIVKDDEKILTESVLDEQELPSNVDVKIVDRNGVTRFIGNKSGEYKKVSIVFETMTGAVKSVYYNGDRSDKMDISKGKMQIISYYGDKKSSSISLFFVTGKHMID